jgi:hypothetical protein
MIRLKNGLKKIALIACVAACLTMVGTPVFAAEPHEDPETAQTVFSGISLFQFYSDTLDFVLAKSQKDIEINIQKAPFANVPSALEDSLNNYISSVDNFCSLILDIDVGVTDIKVLLQESRYQEATPLIIKTFDDISLAEGKLAIIEQETKKAGIEFQVFLASQNSSILTSYETVLDKIQRLRDLLKLYRNMLGEQLRGGISEDQIAKGLSEEQLAEIFKMKPLRPVELTLQIQPSEAFVGDTISIEGTLYSDGKPLVDREIYILLNGLQYLSIKTDSQGYYSSPIQVPYWYIPQIKIQSLYYPRLDDIGAYESSLSPSITMKVLFYEIALKLEIDKNAYPGRETSIRGRFDYGSFPVFDKRKFEIYLDNTLVGEFEATNEFTEKVLLPADIKISPHLITVSVPAFGRYASVTTDITLNVTRAIPVLTLDLPSVAFIPGNLVVRGKLASEIGSVEGAHITMNFEGRDVDVLSGSDGTFSATIRKNVGFGLFGSQSLDFKIVPQEPWYTSLITSHKIMTVYVVNCCMFLFILVVLGLFLPRRIKSRTALSLRKKPGEADFTQREPTPVSSSLIANSILPVYDERDISEHHRTLFYWYRIVIQLIQKVSGTLFRPSQTLREYFRDTRKTTGAASRYILEFTLMMEKILYSPYKVTEDDVKNGEQLAQKVRESLKK